MGIMLRVEQLEYSYGKGKRLSRQKSSPFSISKVNFELEPGYIMGVLGRNASGKRSPGEAGRDGLWCRKRAWQAGGGD